MKVTQLPTRSAGNIRVERAQEFVVPQQNPRGIDLGKLISGFEKDDYILAGIIIFFIFEGCDDYILLAALGYLFFMGLHI